MRLMAELWEFEGVEMFYAFYYFFGPSSIHFYFISPHEVSGRMSELIILSKLALCMESEWISQRGRNTSQLYIYLYTVESRL